MQGIKGAKLEQKCASYIPKIEKAVKDGNTKFVRIFSQTGVLFLGDDGKFTGDITWKDVGGKKALIGWANEEKKILSGYANEPKGTKDAKLAF